MRRLVADAGLHLRRDHFIAGPVRWRRPKDQASRYVPDLTAANLVALSRLVFGPHRLRALSCAATFELRSAELDARSVGDWFDDLALSGSVRHIFDGLVGGLFGGADPRAISLLEFAELAGREGSGLRLVIDGLGLASHVAEGAGAVSAYLAGQLVTPVQTGVLVTAVAQDDSCVSVQLVNGDVVEGDRAVIAVPTPVLSGIAFAPELPEPLRNANAGVRYGQSTKIAAVVEPRRRLQAKAFVGGDVVYAGWRTQRVLYGFVGPDASTLSTEVLTADLCHGFGVDPATVERVELVSWPTDEFTRGTYAYLPPGRFVDFRRSLPHRHRRIHFAGAERSSWPIYMEGAVESGELAAAAISHVA
jgi:monoamine oxidase